MEYKFSHKPTEKQMKIIARIISWNIWQMDGITMTVPYSERPKVKKQLSILQLLNENEESEKESIPCKIFDWRKNNSFEFKKIISGGES